MTSVLIVGAGPTGLTLACELAGRGTAVRIIEKSPEFHVGSRGKTLNPRSLEVFEGMGILDRILGIGRTDLFLRKYRGGEIIADTDPFTAVEQAPGTPYVRGLFVAQGNVEQVLRDRLAAWGVSVELGTELTGFEQSDGGVTATTAAGKRIEASYLVACDGGRSGIRKALPVTFEGTTLQTRTMVIGDVEADGLSRDFWHQWIDEDGAIMLCPLPGTNLFQLQATPERNAAGEPVEASLESFQWLFDRHARMPGVRLANPAWISTYRVNERMADRYRVGRVLLAGDAAHVHSIAGGLGMNTGIQDAYNLGWKLALVAAGQAGDGLLDTYEEERLPTAAWTIDTTGERWREVQRTIKEAGSGTEGVITSDVLGLGLGYRWSSLAVERDGRDGCDGRGGRGDDSRVRAGDRAPDAPLRDADGAPVRLFEVFAGTHFTLIGFGADSAEALRESEDKHGGTVLACLIGAGPGGLEDHEGHAAREYGVTGDALVLVRPDGHIALTALAGDTEAVHEYLSALAR
ncbi:FAD-dependent monooxygenase [Streptomyces sp. H10-C2]|uniref:FAD-dependent monooxygenase n=1 Tax=unclassified Streptomyces TaxID=2593676 RepID=UPI0024B8FD8F|nr:MULTISPECIES: FAD-dependent monooxygenase [unclassified Streptomyces]MDJ0340756.1 FAD-dependent monooxygenase [Streptomyces sp. PH10-H1]MDJ0371972.1 FAD-dependent monooxygenase [Streptomyces sp. H10-C2]